MKRARFAAGDVDKAVVIEPQRIEHAINPTQFAFSDIGERSAEVRSRDRRQAEDASRPGAVGEEKPRVEPPHAVRHDVHGFVAERRVDPPRQPSRTQLNPRGGVHPRHQHAVPQRRQITGDISKIPNQRIRADADSGEPEEAVSQYNWCLESHGTSAPVGVFRQKSRSSRSAIGRSTRSTSNRRLVVFGSRHAFS